MKYRTFGKTGWQVSEIAFGGWQLGGQWGNIDDRESIDTLLYAFEKGINFVDTAESYGNGRSEEVVGRALKEWRGGKIYVATKAAPVRWPPPSEDRADMRGRYPDWYLRENVENSLKRLGVERLDLFQLHCWLAKGTFDIDWLGTLNDLRLEGKIDRIGVSIRDNRPEDGVGLAKLGLVDSHQVVFNMFDQRPAGDLFKAGAKTNTAFIARVPLDSGSLVGNWTDDTNKTWEPDSIPAWLFRGERFAETLRRVRALKTLCEPYYPTLAEAAMRYVLSAPELSTLIPGMKNRAEVDMNIAYSDDGAFPADLLAALPQHIWARNFYQ
ncbi:aldo/keto reductase [Rhizobium jaguaris]|uniref:Aldo/keto reductase n=1 Tax=Rhizobium jaguaris TaxID=1312183 RepID=A0A387FMS2_9HYPH|nr:aldo/keto reductase [Rhizobium jaguaris]AYG57544.1 aldo/keto reductase [Rhizobium jaguaris]